MSSPVLPGRLGSPDMSLRDDPRADPRMIAAMEPFGLSDLAAPAPVDASSSIEDLLEFVAAIEEGIEALFAAVVAGMPEIDGVERSVEVIKGLDGNDVTVYIHRPADRPDALPGVLHLHGGGMVLLEAAGATYGRLRDELAAAGLVVVGVEFRNGGGKHGPHPFPAGLNDCAAALRWVIDHKASLGIDKLIVAGESGGGNLTLATTLRAKRDGLLDHVAGAYAMCPVHLELVGVAGRRARFVVRERRVLPRRVDDGRAREGVRPVRRSRLRSAGVATVTRAPTTSLACRPTSSR